MMTHLIRSTALAWISTVSLCMAAESEAQDPFAKGGNVKPRIVKLSPEEEKPS